MVEIDLLSSLPKARRSTADRANAKTAEHVRIAREYGWEFFDGEREFGYGGYSYDGRWISVAKRMVEHFQLKPGDRVLDVGCAKGFLVKDFVDLGIDAFGLDISKYAILNCPTDIVGRLHIGSADNLPFPDDSFAAVVSINVIHNLPLEGCIRALQEMERLAPGRGFVQVDSYHTAEQKATFEKWVLTARYHESPAEWVALFDEAGYTGDWYWTIID